MDFETLLYERRGDACWITLNRPKALNAVNGQMIVELRRAFDQAEADDGVRAAVLTGTGRAFCAGADLKYVKDIMMSGDPEVIRRFMVDTIGLFNRIEAFEKPCIAAINGIAAAGGIELLLCCDLVVAVESAKIADAHANYGLLPGGGGSIRLPRKIGPTRAKQLLYTGEFLPAQTLCDWGLVNQVVADGELEVTVETWLAKLTAKSPLVLRHMKHLVDNGLDMPLNPALRLEASAWEAHGQSDDIREGLTAFVEKRTPIYRGK